MASFSASLAVSHKSIFLDGRLFSNHQKFSVLKSSLRSDHNSNRLKKFLICCKIRDTRTPHSGYHFDGTPRRFFEGWYFRISIPEIRQSFAWMYSVEDPFCVDGNDLQNFLPNLLSGPHFTGVGAQILGPNDEYLYQFDPKVDSFWASKEELSLGHTFLPSLNAIAPEAELPPQEFRSRVQEGFQVSPTWHQGFLRDNAQSPSVPTVPTAKWEYSTRPIYGWGSQGDVQKSTAGWLASLPVFEPHWQICMAGGLSTGWVEWGGQRYEFEDAPSYAEKNWGGSFPQKWFWIQCNVFEGVKGEVALTAGGGKRGLPLLPGVFEEIAMVGIHYDGKFFEFVPWNGYVEWEISPWGYWKMKANSPEYEVELISSTSNEGTVLRAPTADSGLVPMCKDTFFGNLTLSLWALLPNGQRGELILQATSDMAGLEIGGGPWWSTWRNFSRLDEPQRSLISLPIDVGSVFEPFPSFRPPGL